MNKKESKKSHMAKIMVRAAQRIVAIALVIGLFMYGYPGVKAFAASVVLNKSYRDSGGPATVRTTTTDTFYASVIADASYTETIASESLMHIHNDPVGSMTIERGTSVSVACSNEISFVAGYEVGPVIAEFQDTIGVTTEETVSTSVALTISVPASYRDGYYRPVVTIPGKSISYSIEQNVKSVNTSNTILSDTTKEIYAWTVDYSPMKTNGTLQKYLRWERTGDLLKEDYEYMAN